MKNRGIDESLQARVLKYLDFIDEKDKVSNV